MSEIKGQLLGIIMVLAIFGAISVSLATVFKTQSTVITEKAENVSGDAETVLTAKD